MKKLNQVRKSCSIRPFLLTCFVLSSGLISVAQQTTTALPNNASYSNKTAPQGALRYQRGFYLITPAEMNRSGLSAGMNINAIGFSFGRAAGDTAHGQFRAYLQNTTDLVSRADTGWNNVNVTSNEYYLGGMFPGNYEWQVRANCAGSSDFTPGIFFSNADLSGCNNPYNLKTVSITTDGATLTWEAAGSPVFSNFKVEYSALDVVNWIAATTTDTFFLASGLLPGKAYQWRVRTMCSADSSALNSSSFITNTPSNCLSPTGLNATVTSDTTVSLAWTGATGALYYQIQFRRQGTGSWSATSSFTNTAELVLAAGTTYEWRMRTVCGTDSTGDFVSGSGFTTTGTPVCYLPTEPHTSQISANSAKLTWVPVVGATSYTVRYRLKNTISWTNAISPMTLVCDSNIIVPDTTGAFDIPFQGGSPFTYSGNGVYVAWEFSRPAGILTTPSLVLSTTQGTSLQDANGLDSITYLLCMISRADSTLTSMPDILGESKERPETRFGSGDLADSVEVVAVYALGMTVPKFQSPTPISALVANRSASNATYDVTLTVTEKKSGTVRYTTTQQLMVAADDSVLVDFTGWSPSIMETDSLVVSIPAQPGENVVINNRRSYTQTVNGSIISYDDGTALVSSAGFGTGSGLILSRHSITGCGEVISARVYLTESAKNQPLQAVVRNSAGNIVASSPMFSPDEDDINRYHAFYFMSPPAFSNEEFYIGLAQTASATPHYPVGTQWEDAQARLNAYFAANTDGSGLRDSSQFGRLMILAEVKSSATEPFISGDLVLCTGGTNTFTAGSNDTRFANSIINYSSQYGSIDYCANEALGTPNSYPVYALSPRAWVSSTADGQREFLELSFPGAAPVNFVDIYEIAGPGAVDSVFVKNPGTMSYELVYSATAAPEAELARKNRISFPMTAFNVSEIRIALNSAAVTGYNAIDAVAIGQYSVPGTFTTYLWSPGGETGNSISVNTPGVYTLTTTTASGCQSADSVTVTAASTTAPVITAMGPASFCQGDSVTLTSSQASGNLWSTGATTASITVHSAGSYTVSYDDGSGCGVLTSSPFAVTVNSLPVASITGNPYICLGSSTVLDAGAGFASYFWSTGETTQTVSASTAGIYIVSVTDGNGCLDTASITTSYTVLAAPVITGDLNFCPGGSTTLDAGAGYNTYLWSTGETTQTIAVASSGTYSVTVENPGGCSASASVVAATYIPPTPQISGIAGFCSGGTTSLDAGAGYNTYLWSTGEATQSISTGLPGNYSVIVTDMNGCSGSASRQISVFANPTPVISGTLSFCGGTSTTLNAGSNYASYIWNTGATTQTIQVNTVGTFSVTVTNANGCSASASANTTNTGSLPLTPGTITGPVQAGCSTGGHTYSISPVPNTTHYVWTVPPGATITNGQGSTAITVAFSSSFQGGYIVVAASNACGQSPSISPRKLFVQSLSDVPGMITGASQAICGPATGNYSITPVANAVSYTWTAPAGASIISGQGTNSVTVSFSAGFTFGNLCVTANNACGASAGSCLMLTGASPTPGPVNGHSSVCKNERNLIYSIAAVPGAISYAWTVPQSAQIAVGQGGTVIVVNMGPHSGNISVVAQSACGNSSPSVLPITVNTCNNRSNAEYTSNQIRPVPEVISNYGGFGTTGNLNLEWTVGEPRIESGTKPGMLFTQGFHQPLVYTRTNIIPVIPDGVKATAYPNPIGNVLYVKIESDRPNKPLLLELADLSGRVLQRRTVMASSHDIFEFQMSGYIVGAYYMVVRDSKGRLIQTIKLEKLSY